MIIDKILDRKDGEPYSALSFYNDMVAYHETGGLDIAEALDTGANKDVQKQLALYIINNDYDISIIQYIYSVRWID